MAETLNDSLVKVTEELKEANTRSLEATKELGKVTAATKASYKEVGESVRESLGINKLKDMVMSLPGMNIAKAVGGVVMKKRREKQEQMNLAKRLGITRNQLLLQKAEQEVVLAKEEESKKLIEAAEKLGFNTDRIAKVNEEGNIELNGSLRESNGQFVSKANASAEANLSALKDFGTSVSEKMPETPSFTKSGPSGASASEDAGEERRITEAQLNEQEKQTSLLQQLVDGGLGEKGEKGEKEKGGFLEKLGSLRLALMGLPALLAGKLKALKLGAKTVASTVASKAGGLVRGAKPLAKVALRGAATAAKFIPGIGLAVTAAMGIFDGMSAGIEEYKKSGKLGAAVKEGIAGAASGLTFGLVSQETISAGMDKIGTFFSDGWSSFTDGVGKVAGGIAAFAKDPAGTMAAVGESISTKFTETVTSIKEGATALNTKFADLTGIDIGETFVGLKDKVLGVATSLNTKFTEVTGIDIGESLTGVKDSILGLGTKVSEKFTGLFGEEGFSVAGIKTAITGIGSAISGKFTELTGVELPTFDDVKAGIAGIGASISGGLVALGVPTFSEVTGKMSALATGLAERVGIELPTFDEAKGAVSNLAAGLGSKISGMWDSVTGLFKTADEKQAKMDQRNALEEAKESGLYTERGIRKSLIDESQLAGASDVQLQAILNDDDLSSENMEKVQAELANRTVVETKTKQAVAAIENNATPLGMSSDTIPATVSAAALSASTTASNLTYVPSKIAPLPAGSVSTSQLGSGALMQAEVVQLNAQRTISIQEQSQVNKENAAMAPIAMMNANSQQIINNVTNQSSKTMMMPVPVSDPNVESWNPMNGK